MPYDLFSWNKRSIIFNISNITSNYIVTKSLLEDAHSVHAGSSPSRPTCPSFFFLLHVVYFLAGSRLLIFPTPWGAWPSLTPFPWADPISLRSQATPHFRVGHNLLSQAWLRPLFFLYTHSCNGSTWEKKSLEISNLFRHTECRFNACQMSGNFSLIVTNIQKSCFTHCLGIPTKMSIELSFVCKFLSSTKMPKQG
jgi:hypothetical protein